MRAPALVALASLSLAAADCTDPVQRKNFTSLTNDEKLAWLDAEVCLTTHESRFGLFDAATTLWDEQQYLHLVMSNYIHGVGQFLPWHRYYVKMHEYLLQTYCNYTGGMPYWDEAVDAENITLSAVWDAVYGIGGDGNSSASDVVTDGPFAYMEMHVGAYAFNTVTPKAANYYLNRSISVSTFSVVNQDNVDTCYATETYDEAWQCYGQSPHSGGHAGTGGVVCIMLGRKLNESGTRLMNMSLKMQNAVLSPGDPVFFLHHNNLDRLWWEWQSANLTARLTDMGGNNTPSDEFNAANNWDAPGANFTDYSGDPANVTSLTHVLSLLEILPNVTIADIMDIRQDTICATFV
ncbi:hypothetical protein Daus18300_011121 [Diaporthe australafricana]|uniref:Tyrosinase copper-binding domain-containing protein n=1 Tax=Diaporthe australafricana TaxID=127596 RepID=A0ABR3W7W0_9PEZI